MEKSEREAQFLHALLALTYGAWREELKLSDAAARVFHAIAEATLLKGQRELSVFSEELGQIVGLARTRTTTAVAELRRAGIIHRNRTGRSGPTSYSVNLEHLKALAFEGSPIEGAFEYLS